MAFRKRTNAYWARRAEEQLAYVEMETLPFLNQIDRTYLEARRITLEEVKKLYLNYYSKQGWDTKALKAIAPRGDIKRFIEAVEQAGLLSKLPDGYGFRLSRLELIEANLWLESQNAVKAHATLETAAHKKAIETGYNYSLYNLSKGTGVVPAFSQLNTKAINQILKTDFHGKNYSERIWKNGADLAKNLKTDLSAAVASGQSQTKTARIIRERYNVTRYQASRLVRTETNHFNSLASQLSYEEVGLDEMVYVATLDGRTSEICQHLDGKRFKTSDTSMYPPQHANCRSTTRAYLGAEYEPDERIMRDPATGKNRYVGNISYPQWRTLVGL